MIAPPPRKEGLPFTRRAKKYTLAQRMTRYMYRNTLSGLLPDETQYPGVPELGGASAQGLLEFWVGQV